MSELRYNFISREWVIIATERAKRPEDFAKPASEKRSPPQFKADCAFCPGNESKCGDDIYRLGDKNGWRVRSVRNKFPALTPEEPLIRKPSVLHNAISGYGAHEVLIEHPRHDISIALMKPEEVEDIIKSYKARYVDLAKKDNIEAIIVFKNHGPRAGCSLEHPHSQIVATPIVPPQIRGRIDNALKYFDATGTCLFCRTFEEELKEKKRVVLETEHFAAFMPYASAVPFQTWVFPKRHTPSFEDITDSEARDLAIVLRKILGKLYRGLENPDFNYSIRSVPVKEKCMEYFHWHLSIIPRLTNPAGFELGSGIFINVSLPEQSAEFLRGIDAGI